MAFDTCWIICKINGLDIRIKDKKKTAFMATHWIGNKQVDMRGVDMWLGPERTPIPQITMDEIPERTVRGVNAGKGRKEIGRAHV